MMCKKQINNKLKLLKDKLGEFTDYEPTFWYYHNGKKEWKTKCNVNKKIKMKSPPKEFELTCEGICYCTTPIIQHHLIQHKITKEFHFVGSECIHYFIPGGYIRRCIDCDESNRCNSLRCINCRIHCGIHNEYHDDNNQCFYCIICNTISTDYKDVLRCNECYEHKRYRCIDCRSICDYTDKYGQRCRHCYINKKYRCVDCKVLSKKVLYDHKQDARCTNCFNKPSFSSKYDQISKMFKNKKYMSWLMTQDWFKTKREYPMYQEFISTN